METTKQAVINYLNNLVLEAAKSGQGSYSSLVNEQSILLSELENARKKVLQGKHENYSEEILNEINSKEQIEKKRAQVVNATHGYVFLQKNSSVQPDEAQEIMKNFAELLKEEIVSEARELGKDISFADLPSEYQSKLGVRSWTNTRSLIDGKSYILEFIRSNNDIGENSQIKESKINDSSAQDGSKTEPSTDEEKVSWLKEEIISLKTTLLGSEYLMKILVSGLRDGHSEIYYWTVPWKKENIYVEEFIKKEIKNVKLRIEAEKFFAKVESESVGKMKEIFQIWAELENAGREITDIVTQLSEANSFSDEVGEKFQRLHELEKKLPELISKKAEIRRKGVDYSLVEEIMAPVRSTEFRNKEIALLPLAKEYYIKKIESLNYSDEEINLFIHYEYWKEERGDWREGIWNRTSIEHVVRWVKIHGLTEIAPKNSETNFKEIVKQEQKSPTKIPKFQSLGKKSKNLGRIIILLVVGAAVVGAIGIGVGKWLSSRKKTEGGKKENGSSRFKKK